MTTVPHEPSRVVHEPEGWSARIFVREMWASIAIVAMWVAVAASAAWGADFVSISGSGSSSTTISSAIAVALFASIGTWAVAKHGFGDRRDDHS